MIFWIFAFNGENSTNTTNVEDRLYRMSFILTTFHEKICQMIENKHTAEINPVTKSSRQKHMDELIDVSTKQDSLNIDTLEANYSSHKQNGSVIKDAKTVSGQSTRNKKSKTTRIEMFLGCSSLFG